MMPLGPWLRAALLRIAIGATVITSAEAQQVRIEPPPLDAPGALLVGTFLQHGLERRVALMPLASFERLWREATASPRRAGSLPHGLDGRSWRAAEEGGWRILSRWHGLRLEVLQSRPGEPRAIASSIETRARTRERRLPDGWPESLRGWQHSAQDGPAHTTTVIAHWAGSRVALDDILRRAAAVAGLAQVFGARSANGADIADPSSAAQQNLLMFAGAGSEWTMTIIEHPRGHHLIAHLTQLEAPR